MMRFPRPLVVGGKASRSADPYYPNVVLLLHGDGADGSQTIVDSGPLNKTPTSVGGVAQIDTAQAKWGVSSILFGELGDAINYNSDSAFALGTGDFTVEAWVRMTENSGSAAYTLLQIAGSPASLAIQVDLGKLAVTISGTSIIRGSTTLSINTWYHVAFTRQSGTVRIWLDGILDCTPTTATGDISGSTNTRIGYNGTWVWKGWVDDFRTTTVARYSSAFTPPTAAFPSF